MKEIITISLILILFSFGASAQLDSRKPLRKHRVTHGFSNGQITRPERFELRRDVIRLNMVQRNARRDGIVTPLEKIKVHKVKCKTRRDAFRFRHNGRNRVI